MLTLRTHVGHAPSDVTFCHRSPSILKHGDDDIQENQTQYHCRSDPDPAPSERGQDSPRCDQENCEKSHVTPVNEPSIHRKRSMRDRAEGPDAATAKPIIITILIRGRIALQQVLE